MNKLLIVESPTKARTIGNYLGKEYTVLASVGHVRDLPKSNKDAVDIEGGFIPRYVVSAGKSEVIEKIKNASAKADEVYLATDPDREGEAIAWHIKEVAHLKNPKRVVFHEITKDAIEEALTHPRAIDEHLRARARSATRIGSHCRLRPLGTNLEESALRAISWTRTIAGAAHSCRARTRNKSVHP